MKLVNYSNHKFAFIKAMLNILNNNNYSPLITAIKTGSIELYKLLNLHRIIKIYENCS